MTMFWSALGVLGRCAVTAIAWLCLLAMCASARAGSATLSWQPPTQNTDGSKLTNLAGFRILYGTSASALSSTIEIKNPSVTSYIVDNLAEGKTWYFGVRAFTSAGNESANSNIASKAIAAIPTCTAPQPASQTRTQSCPTGTTGTWTQTLTYVPAAYPTCWAPGEWSPTAPSAGACVAQPKPVDCVVSAWSEWKATTEWTTCTSCSLQTQTQERKRSVVTPASNGGAACPDLVESQMVARPLPSALVLQTIGGPVYMATPNYTIFSWKLGKAMGTAAAGVKCDSNRRIADTDYYRITSGITWTGGKNDYVVAQCAFQ